MWKWLRNKFMSTCSKHGCVMTETITDDVFCGVCRQYELEQKVIAIEAERDSFKDFAGGQMFQSDYRTADEIRVALTYERFLTQQLKLALAHSMTGQGWTLPQATAHIEKEFSLEKAHAILGKYDEDKTNNTAV